MNNLNVKLFKLTKVLVVWVDNAVLIVIVPNFDRKP